MHHSLLGSLSPERLLQPIASRRSSERIPRAPPFQPSRANVTDPSGVASVRLRYRHVTQFEDYETLEMRPMDEAGVYVATVPGDFVVPQWDFMYFIEAIDKAGNGMIWPDLLKEMPYVIVTIDRDDSNGRKLRPR